MKVRIQVFRMMALGVFLVVVNVASAQDQNCTALAKMDIDGLQVTKSVVVPASPVGSMPGFPPDITSKMELPSYCDIEGRVDQRTGADGKPYYIGFELRLPVHWNEKFLYQGGGGLDGVIMTPVGIFGAADSPALARGFAVLSTDGGHQGQYYLAFGHEQQARLDFAYASIGRMAVVSKKIIAKYYGEAAKRSYFAGCSNGGREAMIASQRYPTEFDGILAGDPGFRLSHVAIGEIWNNDALNEISPKDDAGKPIVSRAFSDGDLKLLSQAILKACDKLDGVNDGLVSNPLACHFDPAVLVCRGAKTDSCLSQKQVAALGKVFSGAKDSKGNELYSDFPYDPGIDVGWRPWNLGTSTTSAANSANGTLGVGALSQYFVSPYDPTFDPDHVDFDQIATRVYETGAINDATSTQLSTFFSHGGKLLFYQGMADAAFSANDIMRYYERLSSDNGGSEKTAQSSRLFLVPGMGHCFGGPATDEFDALSSLVKWVEKGEAPDSILAQGRMFPGRTRPLCAYPAYPKYKGAGSIDDVANFECKKN